MSRVSLKHISGQRAIPLLALVFLFSARALAQAASATSSPSSSSSSLASDVPQFAFRNPHSPAPAPLILISIDAMRHDYLDLHKPPALSALARRGVRAQRLIGSFPTLTFPSHHTIVTGLHPGNHGIVANSMYDPVWKNRFGVGNHPAAREGRWWGGEPIWHTAARHGLVAACNFWPGSEAPIGGRHPDIWLPFEDNLPLPPRIAQVLSWLDLPAGKRPALITLYFSDLDHAAHASGPASAEARDALLKIDAAIAQLIDGLRARNLLDTTNIIALSDHGMTDTSQQRLIIIEDYLPGKTLKGNAQLDTAGTHAGLRPLGATTPAQLRDYFRDKHPRLTACLKEDLPARFHYSDNPRIPPVILIPDAGWLVTTRDRATRPNTRPTPAGSHGYDPELPDMAATFIAAGPAFKNAHTFARARNIDIYNLLCALLRIPPAPNDGTRALIDETLLAPTPAPRP